MSLLWDPPPELREPSRARRLFRQLRNVSRRDWFLGAVLGAWMGAILGSLFMVWWDARKAEEERHARDERVMRELVAELLTLKVTLQRNITTVKYELAAIQQVKGDVLAPVLPLRLELWRTIRADLPHQLRDEALLEGYRTMVFKADMVNEVIRVRDAYHVLGMNRGFQPQELPWPDDRLLAMDDDLLGGFTALNSDVLDFAKRLGPIAQDVERVKLIWGPIDEYKRLRDLRRSPSPPGHPQPSAAPKP